MSFRIGKYGAYVCRAVEGGKEVCASLPEAQVPGDMTSEIANKLIDQKINGSDALGKDPATGLPVYVLTGRYGPYVQLGDNDSEKLKRMAIPATLTPENFAFGSGAAAARAAQGFGQRSGVGKGYKKGSWAVWALRGA